MISGENFTCICTSQTETSASKYHSNYFLNDRSVNFGSARIDIFSITSIVLTTSSDISSKVRGSVFISSFVTLTLEIVDIIVFLTPAQEMFQETCATPSSAMTATKSKPSLLGQITKRIHGDCPIHQVSIPRNIIQNYLPNYLQAFPEPMRWVDHLKLRLSYSTCMLCIIRSQLSSDMEYLPFLFSLRGFKKNYYALKLILSDIILLFLTTV